jgi:hypothetical protein
MPSFNTVKSLSDICINSLINSIDSYWLEKTKIKSIFEKINNKVLYLVGPFESLNDVVVNLILKSTYEKSKFSKYHVYLCINTHLKRLDFSFLKKANLIDGRLCSFIGINSFVSSLFKPDPPIQKKKSILFIFISETNRAQLVLSKRSNTAITFRHFKNTKTPQTSKSNANTSQR